MKKILPLLASISFLTLGSLLGSDVATITVKLDNIRMHIPEVKLTKKTNPVNAVLYMGSWELESGAKWSRKPLCSIDLKNNTIDVEFPGERLKESPLKVLTRGNQNAFFGKIPWSTYQATHFAFKVVSPKRQPAVVEITTDCKTALYHNGKFTSEVDKDHILDSGGQAYFPVILDAGENSINIKQLSTNQAPQMQASIRLDHARDLQAAWQKNNGLLKKIINMPKDRAGKPSLEWVPQLSHLTVSVDVRDMATNKIILNTKSAGQGKPLHDNSFEFTPGVYEIIYRTQTEQAAEFFVVGNPKHLFANLQDGLSKHKVDSQTHLDIEAQLHRARLLLAEENYNIAERKWQEKVAYTLGCLATISHMLDEGATGISKDLPGHHIRGFKSKIDNSDQFYKLFIPSNYKSDTPLPLLVMVSTLVDTKDRPFVEGPVMAAHQHALQWGNYAGKHGFAILWPGYRNSPSGRTYEATHIEEAIQAVEKDYNIDRHRVSVYASCSAGVFAGRLVAEYNNRFAAIVYDRAIFDRPETQMGSTPSFREWCQTTNPGRHVLDNHALRIFVLHDNSVEPGHGEMEFTTQFLAQARETRDDVVHCLGKRPAGTTPMDLIFSWLAPCRNENPDNTRAYVMTKAGYTGPISEVFATPFIVVEGTGVQARNQQDMRVVVESMQKAYRKCFPSAECVVKKDHDVTQADIQNNSLVLVGNPSSNGIWARLQQHLHINVTSSEVLYENGTLTGSSAFEAVVRHPYSPDRYVLLIGAADLRNLHKIATVHPFYAWYDCIILGFPPKIISKLSTFNSTTALSENNSAPVFSFAQPVTIE